MNISPENLRRIHELLTEVLTLVVDAFVDDTVDTDKAECDAAFDGKNINALRQKRYRERNAQRNGNVTDTVTDTVTDRNAVTLKGEGGYSSSKGKQGVESREEKEATPIGKPSTRMPRDPEGFDEFWKAYPKHENRKSAVARYGVALRCGVTALRICYAAKRYAQSVTGTEPQFIKAPDVWLNKGCYDDELPLANGQSAPIAKDTRTVEQIKADWRRTQESLGAGNN
jgi:hypothetical protein